MQERILLAMVAQNSPVTSFNLRRKYALKSGSHISSMFWELKNKGFIYQDEQKRYAITSAGSSLSKHITNEQIQEFVRELGEKYGVAKRPSQAKTKVKSKPKAAPVSSGIPANLGETLSYLSRMTSDFKRLEDLNMRYLKDLANVLGAEVTFKGDKK